MSEHDRSKYFSLGLNREGVTDSWRKRVKRPRRRRRRALLWALVAVLILLMALVAIWLRTRTKYAGRVYASVAAAVPPRPVAIVFGAGVSPAGEPSAVLEDRILTAVDLYRAGVVRKLLMSGDNSRTDYDEASAMKRLAVQQGVPERDIVLDYAGFRTYDTLYRARDVFEVRSAVLVTQRYHLPRALYIANELGIDSVGLAADRRTYVWGRTYQAREVAACIRAWLDVNLTRPRPHFLGQPEPIFPSPAS